MSEAIIAISSTAILMISMLTVYISALVWIYEDAEVKSPVPPLLAIVLVFTCFPIGLIVYIATRSQNDIIPPTNTHKNICLISLIVLLITCVISILIAWQMR